LVATIPSKLGETSSHAGKLERTLIKWKGGKREKKEQLERPLSCPKKQKKVRGTGLGRGKPGAAFLRIIRATPSWGDGLLRRLRAGTKGGEKYLDHQIYPTNWGRDMETLSFVQRRVGFKGIKVPYAGNIFGLPRKRIEAG